MLKFSNTVHFVLSERLFNRRDNRVQLLERISTGDISIYLSCEKQSLTSDFKKGLFSLIYVTRSNKNKS